MKQKLSFNLEKTNIIYIDDKVLEKIFETINTDLISLCWGETTKDMYNYKQTLTSFFDRIKRRDKSQEKDAIARKDAFEAGFIGEFLVHCYFKTYTSYKTLPIFFNNQDKSNKRGFDYMFCDEKSGMWYVEIKSGTVFSESEINGFNKSKIQEGYRDCKKKFILKNNLNLWNIAKFEVGQNTLLKESLRTKIRKILDSDVKSKIDNVILSTVVFNKSTNNITNIEELEELKKQYQKDFDKITFLCFRKQTVEKIIQYMRDKYKNE